MSKPHMPEPIDCPHCGASPGGPHAPACPTQKMVTLTRCPTCFRKLNDDATKARDTLDAIRKELEKMAARYLRAAADALDRRDEASARDFAYSAEEVLKLVQLCAVN